MPLNIHTYPSSRVYSSGSPAALLAVTATADAAAAASAAATATTVAVPPHWLLGERARTVCPTGAGADTHATTTTTTAAARTAEDA